MFQLYLMSACACPMHVHDSVCLSVSLCICTDWQGIIVCHFLLLCLLRAIMAAYIRKPIMGSKLLCIRTRFVFTTVAECTTHAVTCYRNSTIKCTYRNTYSISYHLLCRDLTKTLKYTFNLLSSHHFTIQTALCHKYKQLSLGSAAWNIKYV